MSPSAKPFQILALDGGGIKGLFSAAVLAWIEEDAEARITDHFDLITGTSTGGIIALGLGAGLRPREIVQFYVDEAPRIFRRRYALGALKHWVLRKYPAGPLESALKRCFGAKRLSHSFKRLVVPAYNLGKDDVYLFKTPHHERLRRDFRVPMWEVALPTSAAPTYFPSCNGIDSMRLIDGGIWANNPTMVGIGEAVSMCGASLDSISVFSLGTSSPVVVRPRYLDWAGRLLWAPSAVDLVLRGQSLGAQNQALHLLGSDRILRVDPKVPDGLFALDRISVDELISSAAHDSRHIGPDFAKRFQSHIAGEFHPMYS